MAIVFLASDAAEVGGVSINTFTAGEFDSNYTDRAFGPVIPTSNASDAQPIQFTVPTISSDLWLHYRLKVSSVYSAPTTTNFGIVWEFFSANGTSLAQLQARGPSTGNGWRATVFGDTTVNGVAFAGPYGATATFDIRLAVDNSNITLDVYMNGVLVSTATAANSTGLKGKPKFCAEQNTYVYNKSSGTNFPISHSEMVATDGESTIGWRVAKLAPAGNGANTAWTGDFNDLATLYDGNMISDGTVGDKESWTVNSYAGAASPASIRGLVVKYSASKGTSGPQNIEPLVRLSLTDYLKSPVSPNNVDVIYADWTVNPATSSPWSTSDLSGIQIGVRAAS